MTQAKESAVGQEDFSSFLKQYKPTELLTYERDILAGQYRLEMNQPLHELSSPFAKAYNAQNIENPSEKIYALVFDSAIPRRQKNIQALKGFRHPNLIALLEEGIVDISTLAEARYVVILQRPAGQTLAQILAQGKNALSETILIDYLLRPLVEVLVAMNEMAISHNCINLNTIFLVDNHFMLGECISQPAGFSQEPLFEPIDRMMSLAYAKSDYAVSADYYALAMVALNLALGFQPFAQLSRDEMVNEVLTKGAYHAFAIQWDFTDGLQDFFRGLLNDSHRERWDPKIIESWLLGKRFNLILPSLSHETSRGFEFAGETYFNRKIIAQSIFRHWDEGKTLLFDNKLVRWIESNTHKPELAEALTRIAHQSMGDNARNERQNSDLLARMIITLDPTGPLRYKHVVTMVDGIEFYFAHVFFKEQKEDFQSILHLIEGELPTFWIDQQKNSADYTATGLKLQKAKTFIKMTGLGFGIERSLYYLHPSLSCLSPLIKKYHATSVKDLLLALDMIASQKGLQDHFMDRHIAAFIGAKLDIGNEVRIHEFDGIPGLSSHPKLIALKLLQRAQQKAGEILLPGLSMWVASQLYPLLEGIHNRSLRKSLQKDLKSKAIAGSFQQIADVLLNPKIFVSDYTDFNTVANSYATRNQQIELLKNSTLLARHARIAGRGIAQTIAYFICLASIYYTLRSYLHF